MSGAKVNPRVAGLLEKIADYSNIPRKRAKFEVSDWEVTVTATNVYSSTSTIIFYNWQNFVRNSFNVRDQKTLGQLWDAFSGTTEQVCQLIK